MTRRARAVDVVCVLLGLLGIAALVGTLLGVRAVPVLTGSMTPAVPAGSLVLTTPLRPEALRPGQVVAFRPPPPGNGSDRLVMHRVTAVHAAAGAERAWFTTRGDANPVADPWQVALTPRTQLGRERLHLPWAGRLLAGGRTTAAPLAAALLLGALAVQLHRRPLPCGCGPGRPE